MNTINRSQNGSKITLLTVGICLTMGLMTGSSYLTRYYRESQNRLKAEVKQQVLSELQSDLKSIIKSEIQTYLANNETPDQKDKLASNTIPLSSSTGPSETTEQAVHRIVREIFQKEKDAQKLTAEELDSYIASNMELETPLPMGLNKKQEPLQLALTGPSQLSNAEKSSDQSSEEDLSITGGEKKAESLERALIQKGGMLLPKGKMQVEPSLTYAQFSSNKINIQGFTILPVLVIGTIATESVKRNVFIYNLALKYGLFQNFQTEIKIPYRQEHDRVTDTFGTETTRDFGGIGDAEISVSRQIAWEHGFLPDLLATVSFKTITGQEPYNNDIGIGTGHYALRGGLVAVKSSDPAVVFGSLNYTRNFEREIPDFGTVKPGDSIGYSLGAAIALSYQTAINFSFDQGITFKLDKDGQVVHNSFLNTASFKSGFTWAVNEHTSVDFSVGIGLTTDTPDMTVTLRVPHTF